MDTPATIAAMDPSATELSLKRNAAVIVAALVIAIVVAGVFIMWWVDKLQAAEALAFLGPIAGGATVFLWNKQAAKDAADAALSQPTTTTTTETP